VSRFFLSVENKGVLSACKPAAALSRRADNKTRADRNSVSEREREDAGMIFPLFHTIHFLYCALFTALQIGDEYRCLISFLLRARLIFLGSRRCAVLSCSADREPAPVSELGEKERERDEVASLRT
jgi:hypothetical protein